MSRALWLVGAALLIGGCGAGEPERRQADPARARILTERVGSGPQTAFIIRPEGSRRLPVVLFLHGWGATLPASYRPWLDHLARTGNAVIYPRYQDSVLTPPEEVLGNLIAGTRLALAKLGAAPESVVVAGHSAGGALSADYAAIAAQAGLPAPRAILAMYPGRSLRGIAASIPEVSPDQIPPTTTVVALAGSRDSVVGTGPVRRIVSSATRVPRARRRFTLVRDPAISDHLGPQRAEAESRRVFWRELDALIRR